MTNRIENIIEAFNKENCILLTTKYKNQYSRLDYICSNGHEVDTTWKYWKRGDRCRICGISKMAKTLSFSFEDVKKEFELANYTLLSTEYKRGAKLKCICDKGHTYYVNYYNFRYGNRCKKCLAESLKNNYTYVKSIIEKEGYILLTKTYTKAKEPLLCICSKGHNYTTTWDNWNSGSRCAICAKEMYSIKYSGENSYNWKGGISTQDYCPIWSDKGYKADIRERDNNICQNPYCFKTINKLNIHHIDYNKKNCHPSNLITVCSSCNSRANTDREWHKEWYQTLMGNKYNYKY